MNRVEQITQAFLERDTDKAMHGYAPVYAEIDPGITAIFEVGILYGCSLAAWCDLFPEAHVWGIDNNMRVRRWDIASNPRVSLIEQDIRQFEAATLKTSFDLVIDDGSHELDEQLHTWKMFWPLVKVGGCYVVEDLLAEGARQLRQLVQAQLGKCYRAVIIDTGSDENPSNRVLWIRRSA